jgi:hypothetical protein
MRVDRYFSATYTDARQRFCSAVRTSLGTLTSFAMTDRRGAANEELATDVAWFGPKTPRAVIVVTSGTHGIEGFAGSAFQSWFAQSVANRNLPDELAVMLVHALNPYGFSYGRRVNEENIDLNRNFVDFSQPLPEAPAYQGLHTAIVPANGSGELRRQADTVLADARRTLGERGFQSAVCQGQYLHADGLFYGGRSPSWSNGVWRGCLSNLPPSAELIAHIDIHTGLGPFGYGEIVYTLPLESRAAALAREWYTGLGLHIAGDDVSSATHVVGTMNHAVIESADAAEKASISIEFGTVEFPRMFNALRADNWWCQRGSPDSPDAAAARAELVNCFYPSSGDWRKGVLGRCEEVLMQTIARAARHIGGATEPRS